MILAPATGEVFSVLPPSSIPRTRATRLVGAYCAPVFAKLPVRSHTSFSR